MSSKSTDHHAKQLPSQRIAQELRHAITAGLLPPGTKLPSERTLANRYHTARNTAREAIRLLVQEGLVIAQQGRGVFVTSWHAKDKPKPSYVTIADEYEHRIRAGQLPPGTQLPSYAELADQHGVSDIVIRKALDLLRNQGLVRSIRGRGTFVADRSDLIASTVANPTHRSRLAHIVIDVDNLDTATVFWSAALDAAVEPVNPASTKIYRRLRLPDNDIRLLLQLTTDPKVTKERVHIDIETDDVESEVRRLEKLGATRWDHQQERGYDFWVMRDPWGNEFCILQPEFPHLLARRRSWPTL